MKPAYCLAVILFNISLVVECLSAPPLSDGGTAEPRDAPNASAIEAMAKERDVSITFWGRVVDQQGNGLDRAEVRVGLIRYDPQGPRMFQGFKSIDCVTDAAGHFSVENERGWTLSVGRISKAGYEVPSGEGTQRRKFYYIPHYTNRHIPDPDNPVVFRMRKIGETALLLTTIGSQSIRVRPDGEPVVGRVPPEYRSYHPNAIDGLPGFAVSAKVSDVNRDWVFTFTGKHEGDKVLLLDQMPYQAPEEGYESSVEFRVPPQKDPSPERYPRGVEVFLVLRTKDPEVFLHADVRLNPSNDICLIYYNMTINPYGGRSFEPNAELEKFWRLAKTLRREAVQALCAGRLPPEPDIPALIRKAENAKQ